MARAHRSATRDLLAVLCLGAALGGCGGGEDRPPPGIDDVDTITASVARIVFHCRSVEQGFLSTVDDDALRKDVDALLAIAETRDPDVRFRLPEQAIQREATLREQVGLAARMLEQDCSPDDARRLRDAVED
jgi:hypothetical protein